MNSFQYGKRFARLKDPHGKWILFHITDGRNGTNENDRRRAYQFMQQPKLSGSQYYDLWRQNARGCNNSNCNADDPNRDPCNNDDKDIDDFSRNDGNSDESGAVRNQC